MTNISDEIHLQPQAEEPKPSGPVRHILYVADTFYGSYGGAEGALIRLARSLPPDRYRASYITFRIDSETPGREFFPCPFHVFPMSRTYDWNAMKTAWRLSQYIRREKVDLVHTFHETADLFGGLIAKLSGAKVISSRRDMGILRKPKHKRLYRWMAPYFDQVQTVSDEVRNYMIQADGLDPAKVMTVHNGVDLQVIDTTPVPPDLRRQLGVEHAEQLVLTVCNVRPIKGLETLIHAAAKVARQRPGVVFAIVGGAPIPPYLKELEQLRDSLGATRQVIFPGRRMDVFSILKTADLFCLPSLSEGLSNALLEAMAAGLPAVATRVGGNPELVIEGETGFLVPPENPDVMAERLLTILNSRELGRRMGERARGVVRASFTTETMANRVVAAYDQLLSR